MNDSTTHPPHHDDQAPVCERAGCARPVPPSRGTKRRRYCSRSCVQRAYEERRQREAIVAAVAAAVLRERKSREAAEPTAGKSREPEPRPGGKSREPEPSGGRWVASGLSPLPVWVPDE